jgi:RsiW-degrading membrane proteinase PrsW (M82 family)
MILGINIGLLLGLILPPLLYALIVYLTSPFGTIKIKRGLNHIMAGVTSVILLGFISILIPNWDSNPIEFFNTFFFIAPREELVKLIMFIILGTVSNRSKEHPVATMFYMSMVGLGFALIENAQYVSIYGEQVLPIRVVTATIAHMLFGVFMGYWIAKGNIQNGRGNRSVFGVLMSKNLPIKRWIHVLIGWLAAIGYHGLWNYNLLVANNAYVCFCGSAGEISDVSSTPIMIMMIFFGLVGAKFASKDLNDSYRRSLENKAPKDNKE